MKSKWGIAFASLALGAPAQAQTLIHFYDFDGTSVVDRIGSANGTLNNGAQLSQGSLVLDGVDDYVGLAAPLVPTGSGAFSVYINYNASTQTQTLTEMVAQGYSGGPGFYIGQVSGQLRLTDTYHSGETQTPLPLGAHALLLTSGTGGTRVYVDGSLVFSNNNALMVGGAGAGYAAFIGKQFDPYGEWFKGSIDELKVYTGVVSYKQASTTRPFGTGDSTDYAYDALGRIIEVNFQRPGGRGYTTKYTYDAAGNRATVSVDAVN